MRVYEQDKISAIFTLIARTIKQFSSVFYDLNQTIQKTLTMAKRESLTLFSVIKNWKLISRMLDMVTACFAPCNRQGNTVQYGQG